MTNLCVVLIILIVIVTRGEASPGGGLGHSHTVQMLADLMRKDHRSVRNRSTSEPLLYLGVMRTRSYEDQELPNQELKDQK